MSSHPRSTPFETMMGQLQELPLWIKQVLYTQLKSDLEGSLAKSTLDTFAQSDSLQLFVPNVTSNGYREVEQPTGRVEPAVIKLLSMAGQGSNVMNICILNHWSLEQCALYLEQAIERQLIQPSGSGVISATIQYLANKIRLGEYLVQIGRLSVEQLAQALRTQRYIAEALEERTGIGNVLINLGFITKEDAEGILFLKEESKKTYKPGSMLFGPETLASHAGQ
jgi:hypothetical protein